MTSIYFKIYVTFRLAVPVGLFSFNDVSKTGAPSLVREILKFSVGGQVNQDVEDFMEKKLALYQRPLEYVFRTSGQVR